MSIEWFDVFVALGFINLCISRNLCNHLNLCNITKLCDNANLCINPLLYAARYDVFKKSLNKMLKQTDNNAISVIAVAPMSSTNKF